MSWTTPADLRAQVMRLWERGELLRACITDAVDWPLRLTLKSPSAADLCNRFEAVRAWAAELPRASRVRIEWAEQRHRVQGTQRLPVSVWIDTLDDALAMIGKVRDGQTFRMLWARTSDVLSALQPWLLRRPMQALHLAERWPRLLAVVRWVVEHPRPGIYLRQVDVPEVDSKFIEAHRSVLIELLDLALPPEALDVGASGVAEFARRYGFRSKPARIRFRTLEGSLASLPGIRSCADVTLDAESFSALRLPIQRVFITENETNFLAFPSFPGSIAIFGAGYGWEALARAHWLSRCAIHYWGDIDTHGFAILDRLRDHFGHVSSFLMDRETLEAHRAFWGFEDKPLRTTLSRLTQDEQALYVDLRDDKIRQGLRLEQERVGFGWLIDRLRQDVDNIGDSGLWGIDSYAPQ